MNDSPLRSTSFRRPIFSARIDPVGRAISLDPVAEPLLSEMLKFAHYGKAAVSFLQKEHHSLAYLIYRLRKYRVG